MDSSIDHKGWARACLIFALIIGIVALVASVFCLEEQEKLLAIKGGQIHTINNGIITNGVILIRDGIIEDIGQDVTIPSDAEVLDCSENFIMPGIVSPHSYL